MKEKFIKIWYKISNLIFIIYSLISVSYIIISGFVLIFPKYIIVKYIVAYFCLGIGIILIGTIMVFTYGTTSRYLFSIYIICNYVFIIPIFIINGVRILCYTYNLNNLFVFFISSFCFSWSVYIKNIKIKEKEYPQKFHKGIVYFSIPFIRLILLLLITIMNYFVFNFPYINDLYSGIIFSIALDAFLSYKNNIENNKKNKDLLEKEKCKEYKIMSDFNMIKKLKELEEIINGLDNERLIKIANEIFDYQDNGIVIKDTFVNEVSKNLKIDDEIVENFIMKELRKRYRKLVLFLIKNEEIVYKDGVK